MRPPLLPHEKLFCRIRIICIFAPKKFCLTNSSKLYAMKAKPFVKWMGGKGQLIEQLEALLPADFDNWENVTYIEPFVKEEFH